MARNVTEAEREAGADKVARVAAEALALLRTGDAAGCETTVDGQLHNTTHVTEARAKVRAACLALRGGSQNGRSTIARLGPDIRSLFRSRGHAAVDVAGDGSLRCRDCGRVAKAVKIWNRWHAVGPAERAQDLTSGAPCRRADLGVGR